MAFCIRTLSTSPDASKTMARTCRVLLLLLVFTGCMHRQPQPVVTPVSTLQSELNRIFDDPVLHDAFCGVLVQSMDSGEILYSRNEDKLFLPASNMKLLTGAAALVKLGPDFTFETRVVTDGSIENGVLRGNLLVIGGGDPTISGRFFKDDGLELLGQWTKRLKSLGINEITGDVVAVDDFFDQERWGNGWSWNDLPYPPAAEVGTFQLAENVVTVWVKSEGESTAITMNPSTSYITVNNHVVVESDAKVEVEWEYEPLSKTISLEGRLPPQGSDYGSFAVHDPSTYFAHVFRETLEMDGIKVDGADYSSEEAPADGTELILRKSPPLREILPVMLKVSQNLYAETLLKTLGKIGSGEGSYEAGKKQLLGILESFGIPPEENIIQDGSGLSRLNYVTPRTLLHVLSFMHRDPNFPIFYDALSIAGVDGTLAGRMKGTQAENRVHAKTGSLANARSLSGYVTTADGELLAFVLLVNNFSAPRQSVDSLQDLALQRLASFSRK